MAEPVAALDGKVVGDAGEHGIGGARSGDLNLDLVDDDRLAGSHRDDDAIVLLAARAFALYVGGDRRFVVSEGTQRQPHLALAALLQPFDELGRQVVGLLVPLERQVDEHVGANVLLDAVHFHRDTGNNGRSELRDNQ